MKFIRTKGLVIKKVDFGEGDRIITVFSENFGKIDLLVKGIRKSKKRDQSSVDLLTLSNFTFYKKGDNFILNTIDPIDFFYDLKNDIEKLEITSYILSIINEIIFPGERKKEFFQRIEKALNFIIKNNTQVNFFMILKMMNWIVKNEGYRINISGEKYFNIAESSITDFDDEKVIPLKKELFEILSNIEKKALISNEIANIEILIDAIILYEKYINYHLDTKLNLKKHLFGGYSC
ncbi:MULTISPECIES: DNA repair protein RecO [Cetobacterium]|jgi:DNA repair protein RecO (recombination protein O)|uniref:DNA repair protein RecO n=1 Tax=Candidatus Cetobacterium colombiensis TaxID=3073100 RepID=A0ABU4W9P6_9FUSO|nr:DNA repair protein RecO [Candidatus Cetobacterium colombiensis]MDX8336252.1 DNA repair protein RecO [Candidatus Cetobacterium colombiensis]